MAFIEFHNVKKIYHSAVDVMALHDLSFDIRKGQFVVILGQSGAGKTTLLNILGGMDLISEGSIAIGDLKLDQLSKKELVNFRREKIGFVFQFYNLVTNLTALENVELACQLCKDAFDPDIILTKVGLKERMNNFPSQLSGGEQQRVAIARAIAKHPEILLCDEPTGALDSDTGVMILQLLLDLCRDYKITTIVVTHNSSIAKVADKVIHIKNGTCEKIITQEHPLTPQEIDW
jgi:putative ABC transport system ATP-binding protein